MKQGCKSLFGAFRNPVEKHTHPRKAQDTLSVWPSP